MNIEQILEFKGEAIIDVNGSFSFQELKEQIDKYSNFLLTNQNINKSVVVIDSDYSFYSISLLFALLNHNCIIVPIVKTTNSEFNSKIKASEANIILRIKGEVLPEVELDENGDPIENPKKKK